MPVRGKRPSDSETNTPPRRKRRGGREERADTASMRPELDEDDERTSEYERELDRLDAATSTRH